MFSLSHHIPTNSFGKHLILHLVAALLYINPAFADDEAYRLGSGDEIRVTVFGEKDLSGTFVLDGKGTISLPLIGEVKIGDLNLRRAENEILSKLQEGYLKQPRVSLEVLNYRPFYILGEIRSPGSYPYVNGMTVLEAVVVAGGFTYRAKKEKMEVQRGEDGAAKEKLELPADARVQPGDIIRVEERFF